MIGARVVRKEDARLLTGRATFVGDLRLPRMAQMALVRSPHAHAEVEEIDVKRALGLPGVLGAWSGRDLPGLPALPGAAGFTRPVLVTGKAHFVGEPVAAVVAVDAYAAAEAAAAVDVGYNPLPAVVGIDAALHPAAPLLFPELGSNVVRETPFADDAEAELAAAPRRASIRLVNQRLAAVPIETGGCVADWSADGLTLWAGVQAPHQIKNSLCALLGLTQDQVRVIAPDVGGGFGGKIPLYPEFVLAPVLSQLLGRPVQFVETRSENLSAMMQGRAQVQDVEVAFDDDGRLLALRVDIVQDVGGRPADGVGLPGLTVAMSGGCYRIPKIATRVRAVATNTTPIGSYRGAGRPEAAYMIERVIDLVAAETGVDPVEVRRRNFVQPDEFPYATQFAGIVYDSGNYPKTLDRLLELVDYPALRREQALARVEPGRPLLGIGFSTYVELGGVGPSLLLEAFGWLGGWETANVRVTPDGSVTIATGLSPHGQGSATVLAQVASDVLGVPFERITVRHGDTATVQEGQGTSGSRGAAVGAPAVHRAAMAVRERMTEVAAHLLEASPEDIQITGEGTFHVKGSPSPAVAFGEVANAAYRPTRLPDGFELGLERTAFHEPPNLTYPAGAHCCVVEVDRETGAVRIRDYAAVDDCGTVLNPLLAEGQVHGGVAQGIAQALFEEVVYDECGQPLTSTMADYTVPAAPDLPDCRTAFVAAPTPVNPLGAKGLGEAGATAAPQAVVNAVVDALRHLGVRHLDMPLTPMRVWRAMRRA
ncbi:MAG: xanthine dehydrogenase family protein molybdopterin-binding subunit [Egibacteraceae bacterium]